MRLEISSVENLGIPFETVTPQDLDKSLGPEAIHQGVMLETRPLPPRRLEALKESPLLLVLDQVTDPHNVGAILRSAEVFGARAVIAPRHHSAPETGALAKTASGALERQPYLKVTNLADAMVELKEMGYTLIGLDGEADLTLAEALVPTKGRPLALVMGAEGPGLRERTRETCDVIARIPYDGAFGSLNVSNAAAVSLYAAATR